MPACNAAFFSGVKAGMICSRTDPFVLRTQAGKDACAPVAPQYARRSRNVRRVSSTSLTRTKFSGL